MKNRIRYNVSYFIIMLLFFCAGCSSRSEKKSTVPKKYRSLKNLKAYPVKQHPDTLRLKRQQIIGNTTKVPIGNLMDVAVDKEGRAYIADSKQRNIQVYKPNGQFITTLGRKGKGPGEFANLISIQINEGKLFSFDNRMQRAVIFSLNPLAYDATVNLGGNKGDVEHISDALPHRYYVRSNNSFLAEFIKLHTLKNPVVGDTMNGKGFYYFLNKDGKIVSKELFKTKVRVHVMIPVGQREVGVPVDFYGKSLTAVSDDNHIYSNWTDNFLIKVYSPKGVYQRAIYYPYKKTLLSPTNIHSNFIDQKVSQKMDLPKTWPALHNMLIDDQNRLWISTIVENMDVYQWWVLNEKGKLLARFIWPRDKPIEVVKNGKVYTKEKNPETGVQRIVRYKIQMLGK
jgi:hypothetical protein